jgi:hypothetical protein
MLAAIAASLLLTQRGQLQPLPKIVYEIPVPGGQREIVLGVQDYRETFLSYFYEKEIDASYAPSGNTGGAWVDSVRPGGWDVKNLGYMRWSVKNGELFSKQCKTISSESLVRQTVKTVKHDLKFENFARHQWWVEPYGKILRHYYRLQTPEGLFIGDAVYGKEEIEVNLTTPKGTSYRTMFPAGGMEPLHNMFKPMLRGEEVLMREKKFSIFNPITSQVEEYTATIGGVFNSQYMTAWFKGHHVEITGPNKFWERAFVTKDGDLIKVEFTNDRSWLISSVPDSKIGPDGKVITKKEG